MMLIDTHQPIWEFHPEYIDDLDSWKQSHSPQLWFENSCVWFSRIIVDKLGMERFESYTK